MGELWYGRGQKYQQVCRGSEDGPTVGKLLTEEALEGRRALALKVSEPCSSCSYFYFLLIARLSENDNILQFDL